MTQNQLRFDDQVAIVTGAGGGLGKEYALLLAARGASVVVNDLGGFRSGEGHNTKAADTVVDIIQSLGGKAVPDYHSVEEGEKIVKTAIDSFGRIDIVINNAGILRDKSFLKISQDDWDLVHQVHLRGSFIVSKAAWPYLRQQNYGRIIMTCSDAGIFGNFGQSNYGSAKLGLLGLSNTLAVEGAKYNIFSNTIIPVAASRLTEDVLPENLLSQFDPKYVAPVVAWLSHKSCNDNGSVIETAGGWVGKYRWQRSKGNTFIPPEDLTIESVKDNWNQITNMSVATYPETIHDQMSQLVNALSGKDISESESESSALEVPGKFSYNQDDVILYALAVGVSTSQKDHLKFLYENSDNFSVLPTFGVIPMFNSIFDIDTIGQAIKSHGIEFDPTKILHGEQYLEVYDEIPTTSTLFSKTHTIDVLDKRSGAVIIVGVDTFDEHGKKIFYNQMSIFQVGAGGFGGPRMSNSPEIKHHANVPNRSPDCVISEKTNPNQAALYRLSGDKNPLHIDPTFSAMGGFEKPIMHGLCTLGHACRHVLEKYANNDTASFKSIKARFSGTIYPGDTLETRMWNEGNRIHFECNNAESGKKVISGGYVDLKSIDRDVKPANSDESTDHTLFVDDKTFFVSDPIFEEIGRRLGMLPHFASQVNAIMEFNVSKDDSKRSWVIDLKQSNGQIYEGKHDEKMADCVIDISDQDMAALSMGMLDPVKAYMEGRIKVQGDLSLTQKLDTLFSLDSSENYEGVTELKSDVMSVAPGNVISRNMVLMAGVESGGGESGGGGDEIKCNADRIFELWLSTRLNEIKELIPVIKTIYQWNITKNGKVASIWTCDFKNGSGGIYRGTPRTGKADCTLTLDDELVIRLFEGKQDAMKAFMGGKLKISGNILAAQKLQQLWSEDSLKGNSSAEDLISKKGSNTKAVNDAALDKDIEEIPTSGLMADIIFNVFKNRMHEEPDFMKRLRVIFQFNVLKHGKPACIWTCDNKSTQETIVSREPAKGVKPDCIVTLDDDDMIKSLTGKVNPQRLFMMGKVKVKGNIMLLQRLNSLWLEFQKLGKAPELPLVVDVLLNHPLKPGLKSESVMMDILQRVVRLPDLSREIPGSYQFNIEKDKKLVNIWTLSLHEPRTIFRGPPTEEKAKCILTLDDDDLARLVFMKMTIADALSNGKVQLDGDKSTALKLHRVFVTPTSMKPKL